jgi:hypothetical protein
LPAVRRDDRAASATGEPRGPQRMLTADAGRYDVLAAQAFAADYLVDTRRRASLLR